MNDLTKVAIFGRDHGLKGEVYSRVLDLPTIALATSAGVTYKPNEDAMGVAVSGTETILAIADGHWGSKASEIAISDATDFLDQKIGRSNASDIRSGMFSLFEQVNHQLYELAIKEPSAFTPETTLIVCHILEGDSGTSLYWSSFGDSYLFLYRDRQLKQLNTLHPRWLGYLSRLSDNADTRAILRRTMANEDRFFGVADGLETRFEKLIPGDKIFLCTDGLVGSDRAPDPATLSSLSAILSLELPLGTRVEKLIGFALERGEKDNISCVVAEL